MKKKVYCTCSFTLVNKKKIRSFVRSFVRSLELHYSLQEIRVLSWVKLQQPVCIPIICAMFSWVQRTVYGCHCFRLLTRELMLMRAISHGGCAHTVRESALKVDTGRKCPCRTGRGLEPASALRLAFRSDALPVELSIGHF